MRIRNKWLLNPRFAAESTSVGTASERKDTLERAWVQVLVVNLRYSCRALGR